MMHILQTVWDSETKQLALYLGCEMDDEGHSGLKLADGTVVLCSFRELVDRIKPIVDAQGNFMTGSMVDTHGTRNCFFGGVRRKFYVKPDFAPDSSILPDGATYFVSRDTDDDGV